MRRIVASAIAAFAAVSTLSACAGSSGSASSTTAGQGPPSTAGSSTKSPVSRPRQLRLDGVQPCSLLTAAQQQQLQTHNPKAAFDNGLKAPVCDFYLNGGLYSLGIVTNDRASSWTDGSRPGQATNQAPVAGFPTVSHTDDLDPGACDVIVDTADGQYLVANMRILPGAESRFPEKCSGGHQLAEAAMANLLASH